MRQRILGSKSQRGPSLSSCPLLGLGTACTALTHLARLGWEPQQRGPRSVQTFSSFCLGIFFFFFLSKDCSTLSSFRAVSRYSFKAFLFHLQPLFWFLFQTIWSVWSFPLFVPAWIKRNYQSAISLPENRIPLLILTWLLMSWAINQYSGPPGLFCQEAVLLL